MSLQITYLTFPYPTKQGIITIWIRTQYEEIIPSLLPLASGHSVTRALLVTY